MAYLKLNSQDIQIDKPDGSVEKLTFFDFSCGCCTKYTSHKTGVPDFCPNRYNSNEHGSGPDLKT
jgi:hypothetical protein